MLDQDDQQVLLRMARQALMARVHGQSPPPVERGGALNQPLGAFVTLHRRGELRGCLGRVGVEAPLSETIVDLAAIVADSDPRFEEVSPHELADIEIEISVLTPEEEVKSVEEIEVGRHGLIVEQGYRRGLLLPQVATEHGWNATTFLEHACRKAMLPPDAWRNGATIFTFEAQVFAERRPEIPED